MGNGELCEKEWAFGRAGTLVNHSCICPEGFSGRDDWVVTETCHVNEKVARLFHQILLPLAISSAIICILTSFQLFRKWHLKPTIDKSTLGASQNTDRPESHITENSRNRRITRISSKTERKMRKIKTYTSFHLFLSTCGAIISMFYQGLFINEDGQKVSLDDHKAVGSIMLAAYATLTWTGLYIMLLTWFMTLPSVDGYGRIIGYDPFLIRYPNFVPRLALSMIVLAFMLPVAIFLIIPAILREKHFLEAPAAIIAWASTLYVLIFLALSFFLTKSLGDIFGTALSTFQKMDNQLNQEGRHKNTIKRIQKAMTTIEYFKNFTAGNFFVSGVFHVFWLAANGDYQYIFYNIGVGMVYLGLNVWPLLILYRTNGGLTPFITIEDST